MKRRPTINANRPEMREMSIATIVRADSCSLTHNTCSGHAMAEQAINEILSYIYDGGIRVTLIIILLKIYRNETKGKTFSLVNT